MFVNCYLPIEKDCSVGHQIWGWIHEGSLSTFFLPRTRLPPPPPSSFSRLTSAQLRWGRISFYWNHTWNEKDTKNNHLLLSGQGDLPLDHGTGEFLVFTWLWVCKFPLQGNDLQSTPLKVLKPQWNGQQNTWNKYMFCNVAAKRAE